MASSQRSVPAFSPVTVQPLAARPTPVFPAAARTCLPAGRGPRPVAPAISRRDPVRPGARPVRMNVVAAARTVRGGCAPVVAPRPVAAHPDRWEESAPLRLTRRGRRVIAGLSIVIGLTIAAVTATVELGRDGALQLAGSSTVVVQSGDTVWSLAQELAPEEDPRGVVDAIVALNGLDGVAVVPGQILRLP